MRWSHFFGQLAKVYCSIERRHFDGQEEAPIHGGVQEAGGAGGAAGTRHCAGDCHAVRVHPNQVGAWKRQAVEGLDEVFSGPASKRGRAHEATTRDLHAKIGELTVERDFFLRGLAR